MTAHPPPARASQRLQSPAVALGLLALWLLLTLGLRPLLLPDEGRYANVAREMLRGDLIVPTLNGLPFFHKPPLMYWLDMAAMQFFGTTAFAARVGPMLGAWVMGAALFFALRRWHGARAAAIGLGLLATCPFYFVGAQYANHDMLVAGLITAAVLAFARALEDPGRIDLPWLLGAWVACALAMLAKGLIGFVLPALVIGPWLLAQGRWRDMLRLLHPLGLLVFVVVAGPWFVAMQLRFADFFDYFVMEQHFRRFAQSNFNNVHGVWFYLVVLPAFTLPWSTWLPAALRRAWQLRNPKLVLCAWWVVVIVGFFSLPASKLVGYVLPALVPWCVLLTLAVSGGRAWRWLMPASALLCLSIVAVVAWKAPNSHRAAALALAAQIAPGERVAMVDEYLYDLPFYAQLAQPVLIASNWADPELPRHDNWRKELFDAARFASAPAREVLWPIEQLDRLSCTPSAVWFAIEPGQAARVQALTGTARVYADAHTELWRAPAAAAPEAGLAMPRFLRYAAVGGVATATHYLVLVLCVEGGHWPAFLASGFGAVVGAQVAYVGNRWFTFAHQGDIAASWWRFQGTALVGALFGMVVVALAVRAGWHYVLAQMLATGLALLLTYFINRRWTFGR